MTIKRSLRIILCLGLLLPACGDGEMSLTEYLERVTDIVDEAQVRAVDVYASPEGAVLAADATELTDYAPRDLQVALDAVGEIELWVLDEIDDLDPPEAVADLHALFFSDTYTVAREALAARAAVSADWDELSGSPEMAAYRAAVAGDKQVCGEIQGMIDAAATAEAFADVPWVSGELQTVIEGAMGCEWFPEDPEGMFRPSGG
jgi:hypothetical protein